MCSVTGSLTIKRGIYQAVVRVPTRDGSIKTVWKSTGIKEGIKPKDKRANAANAQNFLDALIQQYSVKCVVQSHDLITWLDAWLEHKKRDVRQNSYEMYKSYIVKHIKPYFEPRNLEMGEIRKRHIEDYFNAKFDEGLSKSTLKKHKVILDGVFDYYNDTITEDDTNPQVLSYNPAKRYHFPKKYDTQKFKGKAYTSQEVNLLLQVVQNDVIAPCVMLALFLGLRRSEALGLRWMDIDFERDTVSIENTIVQDNTGCRIEELHTKSKTSQRELALCSTLKTYLLDLKNRQVANCKLFGVHYQDTSHQPYHVCVREDGTPLLPTVVSRRFTLLLKRNHLPPVRFHDLRHTSGSLLIAAGMSPKAVQEYLGHSNIETTLNIYAHTFSGQKKEVADCLNNIFVLTAQKSGCED